MFDYVPSPVYDSHPSPLFCYAIHRQISGRSSSRPDIWVSVDTAKTDRFFEDSKFGIYRESVKENLFSLHFHQSLLISPCCVTYKCSSGRCQNIRTSSGWSLLTTYVRKYKYLTMNRPKTNKNNHISINGSNYNSPVSEYKN